MFAQALRLQQGLSLFVAQQSDRNFFTQIRDLAPDVLLNALQTGWAVEFEGEKLVFIDLDPTLRLRLNAFHIRPPCVEGEAGCARQGFALGGFESGFGLNLATHTGGQCLVEVIDP